MASSSSLDDADLEIFTLIWLDATIDDSDNEKFQDELRQLSEEYHSFNNSNECQLYIQSLSIDERVVMIVSGRLGREIVPHIHSFEQIHCIYVYCFDREGNERWSKTYSKIKAVVTTPEELVNRIRHDNKREILPADDKPLYMNIFQGHPDDQFVHSQLLIHHLLKMKTYSSIDPQFFTLYESDHLEEFRRNYSTENALCWLTKDPFISDLISQSLQQKNIHPLCLTRFFLRDINEQLKLHQYSTSIQLYHSHLITNAEIEQLKASQGKLMSMNIFLITTSERDRALLALRQATDLEKILFEINADPSIEGIRPFANINHLKQQLQIIFMLGSIFRIDNFFQENNIWICQMTLSSTNNADFKTIFEQLKKEDGDSENSLLAFGNMLTRTKQYDEAEKFYQHLLTELPSNHLNNHICYRNLGNVAYLKKDYDQSLGYHLQSLEIRKHSLPVDHPDIADSYNCLGIVCFNKKDYRQAIEYYEKGLKILESQFEENHLQIVVCLNNIALVHRTEENYSQALIYYQKILEIEKRYLSEEDHSDLGQTYHNIGACHWCIGLYDQAVRYYTLSLEIKHKHLSTNHCSIAMILENLGLIYENKSDFQVALEYYRKADGIYQQTLPAIHTDVRQINENIVRVSAHLNQK